MTNKKQKERKKKRREREAKATVARRRDAAKKQKKYDRELDEDARRMRSKIEPIRNTPFPINISDDAAIKEKLKRNMQILEALEAEYLKEQEKRKELNERLEEEGFDTMEKKMEVMKAQAEAIAKEAGQEGQLDITRG